MSKSIRVSDELAALAEKAAIVSHRSPPQQVEHWAQIGRILEPALSFETASKIKRADRAALNEILAEVETPAGKARAQETIRRTSGSIESSD